MLNLYRRVWEVVAASLLEVPQAAQAIQMQMLTMVLQGPCEEAEAIPYLT